jgi:hypothetical protein
MAAMCNFSLFANPFMAAMGNTSLVALGCLEKLWVTKAPTTPSPSTATVSPILTL